MALSAGRPDGRYLLTSDGRGPSLDARDPLAVVRRPVDTGSPFSLRMTPDGRTYAYGYAQVSSELFLMRNARVR